MNQYKAVLHAIYKEQVALRSQTRPWEHIWTQQFDDLVKIVKTRIPKQRKANFEEKIDGSFTPYAVVDTMELLGPIHNNTVDSCSSAPGEGAHPCGQQMTARGAAAEGVHMRARRHQSGT